MRAGWGASAAWVVGIILILTGAAPAQVEPAAVDEAIAKAKQWLYSQQTDGHWERDTPRGHGDQHTGHTALVTYALLGAGERHQDPRIRSAIDYLLANEATGVYALGLRCQVWLMLPQTAEIRAAMRKDAKILIDSIIRDGRGKGFYGYNPGGSAYSHSRGHFGVLGVWAAAQAGVEVPLAYWKLVEEAWIANQHPSGGWTYQAPAHTSHPLTANMTASAVATLFITQDYLHASAGAGCNGNIHNPAIERGIAWLAENYHTVATDERLPRNYPYNTLYGIERVGVASGYKYIARRDWFAHGAEWLLRNQLPDGSWPAEYGDLTSTSFALIFLSRGRAPVAINKLDYSGAAQDAKRQTRWNQRPRDVANVVRWIGAQAERELNWQIVPAGATLEDLLDAPILYISGDRVLDFDDAFQSRLRAYVEHGGLIVGNADCQSREFADSFRKLGESLFPGRSFRELPADHVIYSNQQFRRSNWKNKPAVLAMSNGVREVMILLPLADPARAWQLRLVSGREEMWQLMANVFLYAVDKQNLRYKGETAMPVRDESIAAGRTIRLARIAFDGNWNPEPGGWRRLGIILHNEHQTRLELANVNLASESLDQFDAAHLTGTGRLKLDEPARQKLRQLVNAGGTLIIDAAGGDAEFAQSAEAELAAIFPDGALELIPPAHPWLAVDGSTINPVRYRPYAARVLGSLRDAARIQMMEIDGRAAVVFSREDLSAGMVGTPVDGIVGYTPQSATDIMTSVLKLVATEN